MTMRHDRVQWLGNSPYEHERAAIEFIVNALPETDPYRLWALFNLLDPHNGGMYEIDALVLGYHAIYLIEIKSHPGTIAGDDVDWAWYPPEDLDRKLWVRNPLATTNHKCKVLASQLRRLLRDPSRVPRIEPLVFLSAKNLTLKLSERGRACVVTRRDFAKAITHHDFPGAFGGDMLPITRLIAKGVCDALAGIGVRPRKGRMRAGQYELGALLESFPGIQDRQASHVALGDKRTVIARTSLVSDQISDERRRKLLAASKREFSLLSELGSHDNIVEPVELITDAELGPTVLLKHYAQSRVLTPLLRMDDGGPKQARSEEAPLSFDERAAVLLQVARALAFCHGRSVVHAALCPDAVLIERRAHAEPHARLRNFFLGASADVTGTVLSTQLSAPTWQLYQAPECIRGGAASQAADVFSLGALAYHMFVGRPAALTAVEQLRLLDEFTYLDPSAATDTIDDEVALLIMEATSLAPAARKVTAEAFAVRLEEALKKPSPTSVVLAAKSEIDPLKAQAGELIADRYNIECVRGYGATARVLQVFDRQAKRQLALKVALDPNYDARLEAEAELLRELDHPRIVRFDSSFVTAGRRCITMSLAGERTLADALRDEGALSLDFARRYGEELLDTLKYLELDVQQLHRDVKPANLGVGRSGRQAHHLTLFDFSLAGIPTESLDVGTSAYRDPTLSARGRWDFAADRYAAAVTLYEMLTGVRPDFHDVTQPVAIVADRFDPAVKDGLAQFFRTAFERDVDARYASAEDMRRRWTAAFDEQVNRHLAGSALAATRAQLEPQAPPVHGYSDAELAALSGQIAVEQLRLTPAAKNALARAGVFQAAEILALPNNRLSAIRGIGRLVSEEILTFRERYAAQVKAAEPALPPFVEAYAAEAEPLRSERLALATETLQALSDAGLSDTRMLAAAPRSQVEALLHRAQQSATPLRQRLIELHRQTIEGGETLASLVDAFVVGKSRGVDYVRALWGLSAAPSHRLDATPSEVAAALGVSTAALHAALKQLRDTWETHPRRDALEARVEKAAAAVQRIASLSQVAEALLREFPEADSHHPLSYARAAALVRIVVELQREDEAGIRLVRALGEQTYWITDAAHTLDALRALGHRADVLAQRIPLASPQVAVRELREALPQTSLQNSQSGPWALDNLLDERLLRVACAWSTGAAQSARLEIYPRDMSAERALELCIASLDRDPTEEEIRRRVIGRFPNVVLPDGDAFDELLEAQDFERDEQQRRYVRQSRAGVTDPNTRLSHTHALLASSQAVAAAQPAAAAPMPPTAAKSAPPAPVDMSPAPMPVKREPLLLRSLRHTLERGGLRVITVSAGSLRSAEDALAQHLHTPVVALDHELGLEIHRCEPEQAHAIYDIDAHGAVGDEWPDLVEVAKNAASQLAMKLFRGAGVKLFSRPGLCARYQLSEFLEHLVTYAEGDESPSVFLLVPTVGPVAALPRIEDRQAIPRVGAQHVLRLHRQDIADISAMNQA